MKKSLATLVLLLSLVTVVMLVRGTRVRADENRQADVDSGDVSSTSDVDDKALQRTRKKVSLLDNIFKQTVVLITDKYVHDDDDFAAGSAAVLLFENISNSGDDKIRLIDATGDPYDGENVAKDAFEKEGIKRLKAGEGGYEQVVTIDGQSRLRVMTPVPVVMEKCVMCHAHYADAKKGEPIGAISYSVPVE